MGYMTYLLEYNTLKQEHTINTKKGFLMKESNIHFEDYDYIIYTDASGDDGIKFKAKSSDGSSFTFVASCFVVRPKDIDHNISVLNSMKKELQLRNEQELKSTTLKRHRFSQNAYSHISEFKGFAFSCVAFKKALLDDAPDLMTSETKELSGLTQSFPYYVLGTATGFSPNDKVLIVMDMMKKSEMDVIKSNLLEFSASDEISSNYTLIFRDSKALGYELIQVADVICGTLRTYFESELELDRLKRLCFTCEHFSRCNTKQNRKFRNEKTIEKKYSDILLLHTHPEEKIILFHHLVTLPMKPSRYYKYIDCKLTIKKRS